MIDMIIKPFFSAKMHKNTKMAFAENHGTIIFNKILLSPGLADIAERIFDQLDAKTFQNCDLVCKLWRQFFIVGQLWKRRFMQKIAQPGTYAHCLIQANPRLLHFDQEDQGTIFLIRRSAPGSPN
jgi:hypothetical protein